MSKQPDLTTVGYRIRFAREHAGLTPAKLREEVAERGVAVSKQYLSNFDAGRDSMPNREILEGISDVTGFSMSWLAWGVGSVYVRDPMLHLTRLAHLLQLPKAGVAKLPAPVREVLKSPLTSELSDEMARAAERALGLQVGGLDRSVTGERLGVEAQYEALMLLAVFFRCDREARKWLLRFADFLVGRRPEEG